MKIQSLFIASTLIVMTTTSVTATTFPTTTTPFSKYGQIQNVQNYSSNPFWDPSSPYNQRMPVPVYVQGTDVDTSDCTTIVGTLVSSFCASRNNCAGLSLDDVRPTIMVQLASLPNHNYVTPCAGYVDSEFSKYVAQNTLVAPTDTPVAFPNATAPNTDLNNQEYELQNPYNPKLPTWNGEPWMQDMLERKQELQNLQSALTSKTGLVSIMLANNEIGTIEPIELLAKAAHDNGALFHTDAVQAIGHIPVDVKVLDVDFVSASAHKFGGPKGIGFLYIKKGTEIGSFMNGGAQEKGIRAGTENVASIVGMAAALKERCSHIEQSMLLYDKESELLNELQKNGLTVGEDFLWNGNHDILRHLPGIISLSFRGRDGEMILHRLDLKGIIISTGAACDSHRI